MVKYSKAQYRGMGAGSSWAEWTAGGATGSVFGVVGSEDLGAEPEYQQTHGKS